MVGTPGTSKTFFFESMFQCFPSYETDIIDCSSLSGSGLISYLLETKKYETLKYVCLDEIDKLDKEQSFILLSALDRGILSEKKFKRNNTIDVSNIIFFATANDSKRIYPALKTRFLIFRVLPYTKEQFIQITTDLIGKKIPSYMEPSNIKRLLDILSNSYDKAPLNIREIKKILTLVDPNDINDFEQYIKNFSRHVIMD